MKEEKLFGYDLADIHTLVYAAKWISPDITEAAEVLKGMSIERATDVRVTMTNLGVLYEKMKEEQQEMISQSFKQMLERR